MKLIETKRTAKILIFVIVLSIIFCYTAMHESVIQQYGDNYFYEVNALQSPNKLVMSTTPTPPCGKICSYDWDGKQDGKYYPQLYKTVNCSNILYRMAHSPYPVIEHPPRHPPSELVRNYTIDEQCPITAFKYFDESSMPRTPTLNRSKATVSRNVAQRYNLTNVNENNDKSLLKQLVSNRNLIDGKRVAVVGTLTTRAEDMLATLRALSVTTIKYTEYVNEHEMAKTVTSYRLAEQLASGEIAPFDIVLAHSTLEHKGLGRFGDNLSPFGDLEASAQVWCMVKPKGMFILTVPVSADESKCSIVWNEHRIYGTARLQHLTANWRVLNKIEADNFRRIFILRKPIF